MYEQDKLQEKIKDPGSVYQSPFDVLRDEELDDAQRLEILRSWEQDERELDVAEEEGMAGGELSILTDIFSAISQLNISVTTQEAPTKQGSHNI
jgi:hypothetical protein